MKAYALILLTLVSFLFGRAQELMPIQEEANQLAQWGRTILEHPEFTVRDSANRQFTQLLTELLATENGFLYPFTEVNSMLALGDDEGLFRIFTWQMPDAEFNYQRFGLVVVNTRRGYKVVALEDNRLLDIDPEYKTYKPNNWYGALYYKMITTKKRGKRIYTLLGWAPGKELHRKVIEVISVSKSGRVKFGSKVFLIDKFMDKILKKAPMRLILTYNASYASSVKWNDKEKMIVMDHLSPPDAKLKRVYHMYGPDFSYDGLYWKKGWWNLEVGVQFNSGQKIQFGPPPAQLGLSPKDTLK